MDGCDAQNRERFAINLEAFFVKELVATYVRVLHNIAYQLLAFISKGINSGFE